MNVALYNGYVRDICDAAGAMYVDCSRFSGDVLDSSWSEDGLHLIGGAYAAWYEWILQKIGLEQA